MLANYIWWLVVRELVLSISTRSLKVIELFVPKRFFLERNGIRYRRWSKQIEGGMAKHWGGEGGGGGNLIILQE